jgi:protein-S-isoprenylcysteine O-methyltransferase Ste14
MKLNHNSVSARLYRWFYLTDTMPANLCPYFWKLVIMWIIIVPYSIVSAPSNIIQFEDNPSWASRIVSGMVLWGAAFVIFIMIFPLTYFIWGWFDVQSTFGAWQRSGIIVLCIILLLASIIGAIHLFTVIRDKKRQRNREYIWDDFGDYIKNPNYIEPRSSIIKEFIKARYYKYCPKIDWDK